jgi:hypothetical protein
MHPDLLRSLKETGMVPAHARDWETTEALGQANLDAPEIIF